MPRSTRNTVVYFKLETTSGTDSNPTNTSDAVLLLVSGFSAKHMPLFAERDLIRGEFSGPDKLLYTQRTEVTFSVDLAGSGTAGTAPQWGDMLQACGYSETVTAGQRVDYLPVSTGLKTASIWWYEDGVRMKSVYNAGRVKLSLNPGSSPTLDFSFTGLFNGHQAQAVPVPTLSAWTRPVAVGPANTSALTLGGTYSAGAISGGTAINFSEFAVDSGEDVQAQLLCSSETVSVDNRVPTARVVLDLSAAQEVTEMNAQSGGTATTMGVVHGTAVGNKVLVFGAGAIRTGIERAPQGNKLLTAMNFDLQPTAAGGDALRIVAL